MLLTHDVFRVTMRGHVVAVALVQAGAQEPGARARGQVHVLLAVPLFAPDNLSSAFCLRGLRQITLLGSNPFISRRQLLRVCVRVWVGERARQPLPAWLLSLEQRMFHLI